MKPGTLEEFAALEVVFAELRATGHEPDTSPSGLNAAITQLRKGKAQLQADHKAALDRKAKLRAGAEKRKTRKAKK